jgi:hypothetical protein
MSLVMFDRLPDESRVWIYGINRALTSSEQEQLSVRMDRFIEQWTAHRADLDAGWQLVHEQFIVIAADESATAASGCSIDSLVHHLRDLEATFSIEILNSNSRVFYRDQMNRITSEERSAFADVVASGALQGDTLVFDNTIQIAGELRKGAWEKPFQSSWHWDIFAKHLSN